MYIHDESSMDAMNPESATFPDSVRIAWDMLIANPSVLGYTDEMVNRIESRLATLLDPQSPYRFIIESILIRMIADHSGV